MGVQLALSQSDRVLTGVMLAAMLIPESLFWRIKDPVAQIQLLVRSRTKDPLNQNSVAS